MSRLVLLLFAVIVTLLAVRNLPWHLDNKDQAKQAFTSFEMVERGNWWFQHTPSGKVATKPPLAGWISAALYHGLGARQWDLAWRLPGLACALTTLLILWRAGNRLADPLHGGFVAAAAFGLCHFSQRLTTLVRTDMLLAFFIFLAGYLTYEHARTATPWSTRERWKLFLVVLASMLTKGPIAYAFLLPGLLAFWWIARRRKMVNHAWSGWWPWFAPLLFFGAWAGIGIWQSRDFYEQVVLVEFLGRFTVGEAAVHHNQPVYFYLGHLLGKFAPWSVLLIVLYFQRRVRQTLAADPARLWLVCWALGGLAFMSLVPSKRADRIFPVIPPLCLLVAATLAPLANSRAWKLSSRGLALGATGLALALTTAGAVYEIRQGYRTKQGDLVRFGERVRARVSESQRHRLAVVSSKDEGMLLYTRQTAFRKIDETIVAWRSGQLDWAVVPEKVFEKYRSDLDLFDVVLTVPHLPEKFSGYVLIEAPGHLPQPPQK